MAQVFNITIAATDKATATIRKINDSMSKITRPFQQVGKSFKSLGREIGVDKIGQDLAKIGVTARDAARGVGSIVAPMAALTGVGSIAGIIALADGWAKLGRSITYSAQNIGIGTTQLQQYEGAARLAGMANGAMTQTLDGLGKEMEDAKWGRNNQALMLFNRMGVGLKRTKAGTMDVLAEYKGLAKFIYGMKNPFAQRAAADAVGLGAMLPLIRQGPAAFDKYIERMQKIGVMTPQAIASADEFAGKLAEMDAVSGNLKNTIGNALIPAIEPLITQLSAWVSKNHELIGQKVGEWAKNIGRWIQSVDWKQVGNDISGFLSTVNSVVQALGGWKVAMTVLGVSMGAKFLTPLVSITGSVAKLGVTAVSATTGLTGLAAVFGTLATAIAAATGALIGYETYEHLLAGTKAGDSIGEGVARAAAWLGIPGAQQALDDMHHVGPANHSGDYHPERVGIVKSRSAQAMQFFMSKGWSKAQSAGIVGNLMQESTLNPNAVNPKGGAMGIGQWMGDRAKLFQQIEGSPLKGAGYDKQLDFVNWELNHTEGRAGTALRKTTAPDNAALVFGEMYERFGNDGSFDKRIANAQDAFASAGPYTAGTAKGASGTAHVEVEFKNAPPGTTAKVTTSGSTKASTRIAHSAVGAMG